MKFLFILCAVTVLVSGQILEMKPYWKKCKQKMNITSRDVEHYKNNGEWNVIHQLQACVWTDYGLLSSEGLINVDKLKIMLKAESARVKEISEECVEKANAREQKPWEAIGWYEGCYWLEYLKGTDA